jgi:hypothetical protein
MNSNYYHFSKWNIESIHLYKFIFIQRWFLKKIDLSGQFQSFFVTSWKKNQSKIHLYGKLFWGKKHVGRM